jgi:hypothetical protein
MSDDEADPELLALLRQHLEGRLKISSEAETGVLEGAEYVYDNAVDVALDMRSTKKAAASIYGQIRDKGYSTAVWSEHELHPKVKDEATLSFIFTMDLLNYCFWSEKPENQQWTVEYRGRKWSGYWGMVAALQRALDEGRTASPCPRIPVVCHWLTVNQVLKIYLLQPRTTGSARRNARLIS